MPHPSGPQHIYSYNNHIFAVELYVYPCQFFTPSIMPIWCACWEYGAMGKYGYYSLWNSGNYIANNSQVRLSFDINLHLSTHMKRYCQRASCAGPWEWPGTSSSWQWSPASGGRAERFHTWVGRTLADSQQSLMAWSYHPVPWPVL